MSDLIASIRHFSHRPAFLLLGSTALGLGLAATILVFGLINTLVLRPLPGLVDADRLVEVGRVSGGSIDTVSFPYFRDLQEQSQSLSEVFAYEMGVAYVHAGDAPRRALSLLVSGNYFATVGVQAAHGQLFGPEQDAVPGRDAVVVLSDGGFTRLFNRNPSAIGQVMRVNGVPMTIIGVSQPEFTGHVAAVSPDIFVPLAMAGSLQVISDEARNRRGSYWLKLGGRLADGQSVDQANAELATFSTAWSSLARDPENPPRFGVAPMRPLPQGAMGFVGFLAGGLMVMCVAILLLACANLAGVLLAQGEARLPELALRSALGASRARIVRRLLMESALVAGIAGAIGLTLAAIGRNVLELINIPAPIPVDLGIVIDYRVVLFTFAATALVTAAFGLMPALRVSARAPASRIGNGAGGVVTAKATRSRPWLLAVQSTLTVALLLIAALTWQALRAAGDIDTGFRTDGVYTASLDMSPLGLDADDASRHAEELTARLREMPGVEHASFASLVPLTMSRMGFGSARLPGREDTAIDLDVNTVGEGFFDVFGLPVSGRPVTRQDTSGAPSVAVINGQFARTLFGDESPIGREFEVGGGDDWRQIQVSGVVADGRYSNLSDTNRSFAFFPAAQWSRTQYELVVHGSIGALPLRDAVARELGTLLPDMPPPVVHEFADVAALSVLPQRILGTAAAALGLLALVLAATGLYGVLAYQTERRAREFGVRRALGASAQQIAAALLRRTLYWLLAGSLLGFALAQLAAMALGDLLFGVNSADPVAVSATALAVVMMVAVAMARPLRRAMKLEPMEALRYE